MRAAHVTGSAVAATGAPHVGDVPQGSDFGGCGVKRGNVRFEAPERAAEFE